MKEFEGKSCFFSFTNILFFADNYYFILSY